MLFNTNLQDIVLIEPITKGANTLKIVSGYATDTMVSWHIKQIASRRLPPININLIVGMTNYDGLSKSVHEGFLSLINRNNTPHQSDLECKYVSSGYPVHSKIYLWEKDGDPLLAYMGSANYTQSAFSMSRRELMQECDPHKALEYFQKIEGDTTYCTHPEIEEQINFVASHPVLDLESSPLISIIGAGVESLTLTLLARNGEMGHASSLNWGQREGRDRNQAYIPVSRENARKKFFPTEEKHFSVITDDQKHLILRVEQEGDKAITTPLNNSLIGEYFRNRLGLSNGAFVTKEDLLSYGRTDVTFYKLDEEQFFMDFSV